MELAQSTIKGLESLQDPGTINNESYDDLIEYVALDIIRKNEGKSLSKFYDSTKPEVIKAAYTDVISLFVESARHNYNTDNLKDFLNKSKIYGSRIDKLCEIYTKYREKFIQQLSKIGNCSPCVIDVDWRLDYCIKTSTDSDVGDCIYHVRLSTKKEEKIDYLEFTCTLHQLQELVYKLKDAVRHMEKLANS